VDFFLSLGNKVRKRKYPPAGVEAQSDKKEKILRAAFYLSWRQHPPKQQLSSYNIDSTQT